MSKGYEELANAVIVQAAEDYREALGILRSDPWNIEARITKFEIECFFCSRWFRILTKTDPKKLISRLRREIR